MKVAFKSSFAKAIPSRSVFDLINLTRFTSDPDMGHDNTKQSTIKDLHAVVYCVRAEKYLWFIFVTLMINNEEEDVET